MKKIKLNNSNLSTIVDDDIYNKYENFKWYLSKSGYACYGHKDKNFKSYEKLHRIITEAKIGDIVDHKDRNKLNNLRSNLRIVSYKENTHNSKKRENTKNKYKGVYFLAKTNIYQSRCRINGKDYFLGYFASEEAAAYAYNKKASSLSKYILLNNLNHLSINDLETKLIKDRRKVKKHVGSKYKYISFKKKSGRMKCDKFCIFFSKDNVVYRKGYFINEEDALKYLYENYSHLLNDIGSLK